MRPRLGHIQFLNCLPLYYGLVKSDAVLDVELVKAAPRDLTRMLLDGELDIAFSFNQSEASAAISDTVRRLRAEDNPEPKWSAVAVDEVTATTVADSISVFVGLIGVVVEWAGVREVVDRVAIVGGV